MQAVVPVNGYSNHYHSDYCKSFRYRPHEGVRLHRWTVTLTTVIQLPKPCRSPRQSFAHPIDTDAEEFRANLAPAAVHPLTRSTDDVRTPPRTTPPRI